MSSILQMRILRNFVRGAHAVLALVAMSGCQDELPTITGSDRFPSGSLPITIEVTLEPEQFLARDTLYTDFADPRQAPFLLVARQFDNALDANALARFTGFPDTIFFTTGGASRTDTVFTYGAGQVVSIVNAAASSSQGPARLQLWALDQAWDSASVTWTVAERRSGIPLPWREPGGTRGRLLAEAVWTPGDTVARDSVIFRVDSLSVAMMANRDFAGLVVTSQTAPSRVQLSRLILNTTVRPASRPDTAIARTIAAGPQAFVFSPDPPSTGTAYSIGGLTGGRTVLRLDLSRRVPACASPTTTPACPQIPLREVTLNRASLLLQPLSVPNGFRPLGRTDLVVRRVVETELGRRAPLAEVVALDSLPATLFGDPAGATRAVDLTQALTAVAATDSAVTTVALLTEPEGEQFGYLWFSRRPRLRLVYTLPVRPRFP